MLKKLLNWLLEPKMLPKNYKVPHEARTIGFEKRDDKYYITINHTKYRCVSKHQMIDVAKQLGHTITIE